MANVGRSVRAQAGCYDFLMNHPTYEDPCPHCGMDHPPVRKAFLIRRIEAWFVNTLRGGK